MKNQNPLNIENTDTSGEGLKSNNAAGKDSPSNDNKNAGSNGAAGSGGGNGILAKAHEQSLASLTGITLSGEDANVIILALPSNSIFYIKRFFIPLMILGVLLSIYYLSGIFILFFISFFFAYVINPLV